MDDCAFVSWVKTSLPDLPVIMATACGDIKTYRQPLRLSWFMGHDGLVHIFEYAETHGKSLSDAVGF
jgi:hypothetical protein